MAYVDEDGSWLELRQAGRPPVTLPLHQALTFGRGDGPNNGQSRHVEVGGDPTVSRLHASIERVGPGWCVRPLRPANGLFVNDDRLADGAMQLLRAGDAIRLSQRTTLIFRSVEATALDRSRTLVAAPAPELTATERNVLIQLCLPMLEGDSFTSPRRVAGIAAALFVTQSAVKQHLGRLYVKFGIEEGLEDRRVRLANEAVERGVVRRADLESVRRHASAAS